MAKSYAQGRMAKKKKTPPSEDGAPLTKVAKVDLPPNAPPLSKSQRKKNKREKKKAKLASMAGGDCPKEGEDPKEGEHPKEREECPKEGVDCPKEGEECPKPKEGEDPKEGEHPKEREECPKEGVDCPKEGEECPKPKEGEECPKPKEGGDCPKEGEEVAKEEELHTCFIECKEPIDDGILKPEEFISYLLKQIASTQAKTGVDTKATIELRDTKLAITSNSAKKRHLRFLTDSFLKELMTEKAVRDKWKVSPLVGDTFAIKYHYF